MALDLNLPNTPQDVRAEEDNLHTQFTLIYEALRKIADNVGTEESTGEDDDSTTSPPVVSTSDYPVYIQDSAPANPASKYLWVQTNIDSDGNFIFWFVDSAGPHQIYNSSTTAGTSVKYFQKGASWDCGGAVELVAADCKEISVRCTQPGVIKKWTIMSEALAGDIEFDVWKTTFGAYPATVANSIVGGDYPGFIGGVIAQKSNLSLWTDTEVSAGTILTFKVRSAAILTQASIILDIEPT